MKKIISLALMLVMLVTVFAFASCNTDSDVEYELQDAQDLLAEDFGIAVKKGNTAMKAAIDEVINEWKGNGTLDNYINYYQNLAEYEEGLSDTAPDAGNLKTSWSFGNGGTITVYTESGFAPFEFISGDDIIGVDIALMSEVAERRGKSIDIQDVGFDTIPTCVSTATGDAVGAAGLTINAERLEVVDFSVSYFSSTLVIVSANGQYKNLRELDGLTVGVQTGTSGDLIISKAADAGYTYENEDGNEVKVTVSKETEVKRYKQYALAYADLKAGRVDAILMDKLPAQTMLAVAD